MDIRSSVLDAKGGSVLVARGVDIVAVLNLVSQVFVDRAGLVVNFDLPEAGHAQEEVLVVDETLVLRQALVIVPNLPIHAVEERPLGELQGQDICVKHTCKRHRRE